jgi:hypothetical protein
MKAERGIGLARNLPRPFQVGPIAVGRGQLQTASQGLARAALRASMKPLQIEACAGLTARESYASARRPVGIARLLRRERDARGKKRRIRASPVALRQGLARAASQEDRREGGGIPLT